MPKNRIFVGVTLALLLAVASTLAFVGNSVSNRSMAGVGADLNVPSANMQMAKNFQAKPGGVSVALPWANTRVNGDSSIETQNEPFVAVNPNNSKHMVVGANNWLAGDGHFEVYAYVTFDGGQTWAASQPYIDRNASRLNAADPTVAFAPNGDVYFAFVAMSPAQGAVAVSRSVNGGRTWSSQSWATSFTSGADKPAIAAASGNLYLFWQSGSIYGRVSADNGASWGQAVTVAADGRNAAPVVDSKGAINVFYTGANSIALARSTNGGASYSSSTVASVAGLSARPTHYRASVYPAVGVDSKNNLYVAWADGVAGRGNDIRFSRSVNGGANWSSPVTLNTDAGSSDQLMPAIAVGKDGAVNVAWLDNRNDAKNYNYDVYFSPSLNAGASFSTNTRVTDVSSNPDNDGRTQGSLIGDYFALAAGDGTVHPFWTDTRNGNEDIYTAAISVNANN